ncbi:MAG: hypothetical protein LLF98_02680 [Clostridium sp.]|uniref:hypothetical protein n=1 Tax=Clostridium sp. TaxID=1506 RepID=UPI0025BF4D77|nr:hypothetical protein [Clostridium sp.]MCE5220189.1 hypothetical protein [Clostridium sp.]
MRWKFELTSSQIDKIKQWDNPKTGHKCTINKQGDVTGARLEYIFIPTGLGDIVRVKCDCGAMLDVTEY